MNVPTRVLSPSHPSFGKGLLSCVYARVCVCVYAYMCVCMYVQSLRRRALQRLSLRQNHQVITYSFARVLLIVCWFSQCLHSIILVRALVFSLTTHMSMHLFTLACTAPTTTTTNAPSTKAPTTAGGVFDVLPCWVRLFLNRCIHVLVLFVSNVWVTFLCLMLIFAIAINSN